MTQEMLFSKYAEQYPLTVPQEAVENELQLLILEEKQRIQYETLTGFAVHLSPQEELNKKWKRCRRKPNAGQRRCSSCARLWQRRRSR